MASLRIPERHLAGLTKLLSLPGESFRSAVTALEGIPVSKDPQDFVENALRNVEGLSSDDLELFAEAILSLVIVRASFEDSTSEYIEQVESALKGIVSDELKLSEEDISRVPEKLSLLLENTNLLLSAKSVSMMFEHDALFSKARVLTQILPVFGNDVNETPKGALLTHQLGIHYFKDGRHKEFFLVLDDEEIQTLIKVLERAKAKADTLKTFLASTSLHTIEDE